MASKLSALMVGLISLSTSAAYASLQTDFSNWTVDRRDPAGFINIGPSMGRTDVLEVKNASGDYSNTDSDMQGRGHTLSTPAAVHSVAYGSVYVPADWETNDAADMRYSVLSAFATASSQGTCVLGTDACTRYLNFAVTNTGGKATAGPPASPQVAFRTSAGITSAAGDTAMPAWALQPGVALDAWNDVCIVLSADKLRHYANGAVIRDVDISATPATTKPDQINRIVVNTQNRGTDYDVQWSNLGVGTLGQVGVTSGQGQSTAAGTAFAEQLRVQVLDTDGAPLPCVEVTFSAPATGASAGLSQATVLTDYTGSATINATANGVPGAYSVLATLPNLASRELALTNTANAPASVTPVPTLGEWALYALAAMLAGFGALRLRRRF